MTNGNGKTIEKSHLRRRAEVLTRYEDRPLKPIRPPYHSALNCWKECLSKPANHHHQHVILRGRLDRIQSRETTPKSRHTRQQKCQVFSSQIRVLAPSRTSPATTPANRPTSYLNCLRMTCISPAISIAILVRCWNVHSALQIAPCPRWAAKRRASWTVYSAPRAI